MKIKILQSGYIGVVTVLIVSGIALTVGVSIALLGINESLQGFILDESEDALQLADGCAEEAHFRLKKDNSYTGGTIPYSDGDCTVTVSGGGVTRTITSTFTKGEYTKSLTIDVTLEENVAGDAKGVDVTDWGEQ